jgi:hypothetical protein
MPIPALIDRIYRIDKILVENHPVNPVDPVQQS